MTIPGLVKIVSEGKTRGFAPIMLGVLILLGAAVAAAPTALAAPAVPTDWTDFIDDGTDDDSVVGEEMC